ITKVCTSPSGIIFDKPFLDLKTSRYSKISESVNFNKFHSSFKFSRSQQYPLYNSEVQSFDIIVIFLAWEKDAVLRPNPNLPKSCGFLRSSNDCDGILSASIKLSLVIPLPLSPIKSAGKKLYSDKNKFISVAFADIELSIK